MHHMTQQSLFTTTTLCLVLGSWPQSATAKAAKANGPSHRGWANPQGVLVSTDGGRVNTPEKKDKSADDPPPPASNEELKQLVGKLTASFTKCLATLREATPALQANGAHYAFSLDFVIGIGGQVGSINQAARNGTKDLPDCAKNLRDQVATHRFTVPLEAQPLDAHLEYEAIILNDADAQGRGFQFVAGEKAWEAALRAHKEWFRCSVDADCVVTAEQCEVKAIHKDAVKDYREAIQVRKKSACFTKIDLGHYLAKCRDKRCVSRKAPGAHESAP